MNFGVKNRLALLLVVIAATVHFTGARSVFPFPHFLNCSSLDAKFIVLLLPLLFVWKYENVINSANSW